MEKFKFLPKSKISQLPKTPGVYAFKKGAELLYIGKAVNIRERAKQHPELLGQAEQLGYIKTDSEIEALILEASLIKKYQPKHNIVWRDDKNYFYICITKEDFPRIFITHRASEGSEGKNERGLASFIGPFVDGKALKETLKILRKVFPYRTCRQLPKKPCLWYQLDRCPAPCLINPQVPGFEEKIKKECRRNAKSLIKILRGKKRQALNSLQKEMKRLSQEEKFEEAGKIKNQIRSLEKVFSHAHIFDLIEAEPRPIKGWDYRRIEAYDVSNIQGKEATGSMVTFIDGKPAKDFYRKFKIKIAQKPNDVAMLKEVLERRLRHKEWPYPDLILIDGGKAQLNVATQCLKSDFKQIQIMSLAKKENKLFTEGKRKPVLLKKMPGEIFNLILQLRDEAHRFARAYHLKLRKRALLS